MIIALVETIVQVRHRTRLAFAESECARDRASLQRDMKQEVDEMARRHENELLTLIEEVTDQTSHRPRKLH